SPRSSRSARPSSRAADHVRAVVLDEDRSLGLRDVPEPEPTDGQALVRVRAAGVNYADVLIREGRYPQPPPLPFVPGSEIAGETEDGRRVLAVVRIGGGGVGGRGVRRHACR